MERHNCDGDKNAEPDNSRVDPHRGREELPIEPAVREVKMLQDAEALWGKTVTADISLSAAVKPADEKVLIQVLVDRTRAGELRQ
jgi:hypothetical protein